MTTSVTSDVGPFAMVPLWLPAKLAEVDAGHIGSALRVWVALHHWTVGREGSCYPRHALIAAKADLSVAAVKGALNLLRDVGAVTWQQRRTNDGDLDTNLYQLHYADPAPQQERTSATPVADGSATGVEDGSATTVASKQTHLEVDPLEADTHALHLLTAPEPSSGNGHALDALFETCWTAYGRVGAKKKARECWDRATRRAHPDAILAGLLRWKEYWDSPGAAQVKWPQGWLNEDRWCDDPPPIRCSSPPPRESASMSVIRAFVQGGGS